MITLSLLIEAARRSFDVEVGYVHPSLFLFCVSADFEGLDPDQRLVLFAKKVELPVSDIQSATNAASASLTLVTRRERETEYDFVANDNPSHWLPLLDQATLDAFEGSDGVAGPRAFHFFGFKGGQGRSTSLGMLSKALANDGYRVLVVDADIEAPSLDVLFDVKADTVSATLMGLCGWATEVSPQSAHVAQSGEGKVDILTCRPSTRAYDMDFAAFALRTALDTSLLFDAVTTLRSWADKRYDYVLFDHRTGISSSILPVVRGWPGSVVVAVRLDGLSDQVTQLYQILFSNYKPNPGAFISFSLDPEDTHATIVSKRGATIERLLGTLAEAIEKGAEDPTEISPDILQTYWITWFHDRALLSTPLPHNENLSKDNQNSLKQLRDVLGASTPASPRAIPPAAQTRLSPSGAIDEGWFIETRELARLFQPNTNISYVFGRKGTGKTRLFQELTERRLAQPLMSAADYLEGGLQSGSILFKQTLAHFDSGLEGFWWSLLVSALECSSTTDKDAFEIALRRWTIGDAQLAKKGHALEQVASIASKLEQRRVFAIDGVETAVKSSLLRPFVESLFQFLLTVQVDPRLSSKVAIRLFLRTDLSRTAVQNIEQQTSGRSLELRWDVDAIFNFVLARIAATPWFEQSFAGTCEEIRERSEEIQEGKLDRETYTRLLLQVFPDRLRRNNLQTMTFFTGYFSDAVGEDESRAAFYPRLFENFLEAVANPSNVLTGFSGAQIEDQRVSQALVLRAHESASQQFISEIKQELFVLLEMGQSEAENKELVNRLIGSFDGLRTPFRIDDQVSELAKRMNGVDPAPIRDAMNRLKDLGIFEDRAGYPGEWRAGRLYKSALRMKYYRV